MARSDRSDPEWGLIQPLLPNIERVSAIGSSEPRGRGVARVDDRRVLNGIFRVLGTGSPRRDRKVQRSVDPALCRQRNLIERFFNKLKHFR